MSGVLSVRDRCQSGNSVFVETDKFSAKVQKKTIDSYIM